VSVHRRFRLHIGWLLFVGGFIALTVSDALYTPARQSQLAACLAFACGTAGIAMVGISVWMAVGAQLRRIPQLNVRDEGAFKKTSDRANSGQPQSPPSADQPSG
jgi:hypothetical protein